MKIMNPYIGLSKNTRGGLEKIYLIAASKVLSVGYDSSSGYYHSITLDDNASFMRCVFAEGEAIFQEALTRKNGNVTITQTLEFSLANQTQQAIEIIEDMAQSAGGLVGVVVDQNGLSRIVGYSDALGLEQPLELSSAEGSSQSDFEKVPYQKLVLSALSPCKAGVLLSDMSVMY